MNLIDLRFEGITQSNPLFIKVKHLLEQAFPSGDPPDVSTSGIDRKSIELLKPDSCGVFCNERTEVSVYARSQMCHAIAAYEHYLNPKIKIGFGFAYSDDLSTWYMHSFNISEEGNVIEPTPLIREIYWGRILTLEESQYCIEEEWSKLQAFGLV